MSRVNQQRFLLVIKVVKQQVRKKQSSRLEGKHNDAHLNESIVRSLQRHLQRIFPNSTKVTIRNDKSEPMDVVYARMIGASKAMFCGPSSFCLIAALGRLPPIPTTKTKTTAAATATTTGATISSNTYVMQGPLLGGSPNWMDRVERRHPHIRYVNEPILRSTLIYKKNETEILRLIEATE